MTDIKLCPPNKWKFKAAILTLLIFLGLGGITYAQLNSKTDSAILQAVIHVQPLQPISTHDLKKIQPGTPVKIEVVVENKGEQVSPAGFLFVRYALAKPLQNEIGSIIFSTEKQELPPINSGEQVKIVFATPHETVALLDFVRDDWSLREYQAVAEIQKKDKVIGSLPITFSAYYYPGIAKQFPSHFFTVEEQKINQ